ncbi:hypothetical protein LTR49_024876 [Elasticomyces elasticus]|nr:hypothetical protein LTR49_024876 [Elasticomyces elasticus]
MDIVVDRDVLRKVSRETADAIELRLDMQRLLQARARLRERTSNNDEENAPTEEALDAYFKQKESLEQQIRALRARYYTQALRDLREQYFDSRDDAIVAAQLSGTSSSLLATSPNN